MPHPEFLSGQRGYAEDLTSLAIRGSYTPELTATTTDPSLGTLGISDGDFWVTGSLVTVQFAIQFAAGASSGSGQYRISLPDGLPLDAAWARQTFIGQARLRDASATEVRAACVTVPVTVGVNDRIEVVKATSGGVGAEGSRIANDNPWTWAADDSIRGTFTYLTPE